MKAQDKLIKFMQIKANVLREYGINPKKYFNLKDKKILQNLDDELAQLVWLSIKYNIKFKHPNGLIDIVCPFCILSDLKENYKDEACSICVYGKNHGICFSGEDDITKIEDILQEKYNITFHDVFPYDFYYKTIIKIEEEE